MLKTVQIIEASIEELESELAGKHLNDFLSIELIEADLEKLRHMHNHTESLNRE